MKALETALKAGVDLRGIAPECVMGIVIAAAAYEIHGVPFVITSVRDGKHGERSYHYRGMAFDCRLPSRYTGSEGTDEVIRDELKRALGPQFDVVLESDHLHCEFDPKDVVPPRAA